MHCMYMYVMYVLHCIALSDVKNKVQIICLRMLYIFLYVMYDVVLQHAPSMCARCVVCILLGIVCIIVAVDTFTQVSL